MSDVIIRNLRKGDGHDVALLIPQLTQNIVEPEKFEKRIEELMNEPNCRWLVADKDGKVVGCGGLLWYKIPSKGLMGWIEEVVVDDNHRGYGIGHALIADLLSVAECHGLRQVKLTTTNDYAAQLYKSLGFDFKNEDLMIEKYY